MLVAAGCGERRPPTFPVSGELFSKDGKPAAGAVVYFHPETAIVDSENPATSPRPSGKVAEDGKFEISTFGLKDGAPAGKYRLSVVWNKNSGDGDDATSLLSAKYMNPATAELPIVEVLSAPTVLPPIKLDE